MKIKNTFLLLTLCSSLALNAAELKKQPRNPEEPATGEIITSAVQMEAIAAPLAAFASNPAALLDPVTAVGYVVFGALGGSILGLVEGTTFATVSRAFGTKSKLTVEEVMEPLAVAIATTSAVGVVDTLLNPVVSFTLDETPKNTTVTPKEVLTSYKNPKTGIQLTTQKVLITYKDPKTGVESTTNGTRSELTLNDEKSAQIIQDRTPYGTYAKAAVWLSLAGYLIYKRHAISAENRKKEKELITKALTKKPLAA